MSSFPPLIPPNVVSPGSGTLSYRENIDIWDIPRMTMFDIAVYGSTSGAVAAAIQAARLGRRTVLISPDEHIGESLLLTFLIIVINA